MAKNIGYIQNPFGSFDKKTKIGVQKTKCYGCKGCEYEYYGHTALPCCNCTHNMRNKDNISAKNYYQSKKKGSK